MRNRMRSPYQPVDPMTRCPRRGFIEDHGGSLAEEAIPPRPQGITPPPYFYPRKKWPSRKEAKETYAHHREVMQTWALLVRQFDQYCHRGLARLGPISTKLDKQYRATLRFIHKKVAPAWGSSKADYTYSLKRFQQHSRGLAPELAYLLENLDLTEQSLEQSKAQVLWLDEQVFGPTVPLVHPLEGLAALERLQTLTQNMVHTHDEVQGTTSGIWNKINAISIAWDTVLHFTDDRYDRRLPAPSFIETVLDKLPASMPEKGTGPLDVDLSATIISDLPILIASYTASFSRHFIEKPKY